MLHVKEKKRKKGGRFRVRVLLNEKEYLFFSFFWQFFILVLFHFFVVTNFVEIFLVCVFFRL